jgi:hypothetical protein
MHDLTEDIRRLLVRELEGFKRELALFPDDESAWRVLPGVANSAANLGLHVAGNLQYFVGAMLGGSGYRRDRDAEFNRRSGSRQEIIAEADLAIDAVRRVLPTLSAAQLAADFPEAVMGVTFPTQTFLLHLCAHAAFHLGQAGYLRRMLTEEERSSGPIPLAALV